MKRYEIRGRGRAAFAKELAELAKWAKVKPSKIRLTRLGCGLWEAVLPDGEGASWHDPGGAIRTLTNKLIFRREKTPGEKLTDERMAALAAQIKKGAR